MQKSPHLGSISQHYAAFRQTRLRFFSPPRPPNSSGWRRLPEMFLSQHNYTFCIPPGLAKVYPPHPKKKKNRAANYTTPKYAKSRSGPINSTFHSRPQRGNRRSGTQRCTQFWEECEKCKCQMRHDFTHNLSFYFFSPSRADVT